VISSFRREVAENCAPLGNYVASNGNYHITQQLVVITTNRCVITQKSAVFLPIYLSTHTTTQVR